MRAECVIVGAGLAGVATARSLVRRGVGDVVILEQEPAPGSHSSGRNASMLRQIVSEPPLAALARHASRLFDEASAAWRRPELIRRSGSLLLAGAKGAPDLERDVEDARRGGLEVEIWSRRQIEERVPATRGGRFEIAAWTPSDGVIDVHVLLEELLREARGGGARLVPSTRVSEIIRDDAGGVRGVRAGDLEVLAPRVVNAAGPWAGAIARLAGPSDIPIAPYRRHLFFTGSWGVADTSWPYVWDVEEEVYFRPESGGLLLCPCDETEFEPCLPATDHEAAILLEGKLRRSFPALAEAPVARVWAGLRTFAADRLFVIGADPSTPGLFWAAGLGGHGVTTSLAVGELAAEAIVDPDAAGESPFRPARFAASRAGA